MRRAPSAPAVTAVVVRCLVSLGSAARATRGLCFAAGNRPDYAAARAVRMRPLRVRGGGSRGVGLGAPDSAAPTTTFSIETTPKLSSGIETHRAFLPPGTPVYVAAIPGTSLTDTAELCRRLGSEGLDPVPHLAARALRDDHDLETWLETMRGSGVNHVLLLAGDNEAPAGIFASSLDVLLTGLLQKHGISQVDVVAHPEGSPRMPDPVAELLRKVVWAQEHHMRMDIVTQVCFDVNAVSTLCKQLRKAGAQNCIRVGLPGLATPATLLKYAAMCGVGPSISILKNNPSLVLGLTRNNDPGPLLDKLTAVVAADAEGHGHVSAHFFSFGNLERTARWATQRFPI